MQYRNTSAALALALILISLPLSSLAETPKDAQPFDDLQARSKQFADELGRLKAEGQTLPTDQLVEQAQADKTYPLDPAPVAQEKFPPSEIYTRCRPGVMILGGIYKCKTCNNWHAQCAGGFVVRADGLIVTNLHVVESFKKLEAAGAMTDDGRVFPIKAVLAASRVNDLALIKIDADNLQPLPIAADISVGSPVACLSHPVLSEGKLNCFYAFTTGEVSGKFALRNDKHDLVNILAVTAEYGPGASGGPILDEHGAVVAVVCQAVPLQKMEHEKEVVPMVWKFARPSCSILALFGQ
jgi:S1-C subfamily serine protease